jgi:hypothetical protein
MMRVSGTVAAMALTWGVMTGPLAAQTAKITVKEEKPGLLAKAKVTAEAAIATAQAKVPKGKLAASEIEQENGKLIFSFDFKTEGKTGIDEVNVDAITGKFVAMEHESPEADAREKAADAKKGVKKPA